MNTKYKFIYFDLDRTLWDFESNSVLTFKEIFENRKLNNIFPDFDAFITSYKIINEQLWDKYRKGEINKEYLRTNRFLLTLEKFGVTDLELAKNIGTDYINESPKKTGVFPFTYEILDYLSPKYKLAILTNGFKEVQTKKLRNCNLDKYFTKLICSEDTGYQKPNSKIFQYALSSLNAKKTESIMIGDDLKIDISGAKDFNMDTIYCNFINNKKSDIPTYQISSLKEIRNIL